ncbi:MAG: purine-nucleoside phosphorylase, partial [Candidatus Faecousia sp.]|nr:purine-nucleoside phosphorylase [Candidatus Faecousia sp.]
MSYPTPHINATPADFGQTVLMPGDPLRSKYIAEHFLENPVLVNNVRGVQGYTGLYKGVRVSVMASGMGMPSIGIYSRELFENYDVRNIMRIGS